MAEANRLVSTQMRNYFARSCVLFWRLHYNARRNQWVTMNYFLPDVLPIIVIRRAFGKIAGKFIGWADFFAKYRV